MNGPKVSIVTPSYQQGDFIEETLKSVARQSYDRIEHLVVDGGSTDQTLDLLRKYEDRYSLRWLSEPDDGQSDAINKGFDRVTGDIVGWINSDDFYYDSDVVATAVDRFTGDSELDILYGSIAHIDEHSHIQRFQPAPEFNHSVLRGHDYIPQPGVFLDSEVVSEYRLRSDYVFAMDYEYWLRLASEGRKFGRTSKVMAAYRGHDSAKGPSLGLDRLYEEKGELQERYGRPDKAEELSFKVRRKLGSLVRNGQRWRDRDRQPPILRYEEELE